MAVNTEIEYVVKTDLDPVQLNRVGLYVFRRWMEFALGTPLGGKKIVYPTGRYAASLRFEQTGIATVAVVADESTAPEAAVLETGHGSVDLKTRLSPGRVYPMHRPVAPAGSSASNGLRRQGSGLGPSSRPQVWAEARVKEGSGFASMGPNSPPDSWIIPPMAAYSPAAVLASMIASRQWD